VSVGPGAALIMRDVSASLLLPGPHGEHSTSHVAVRICAGATFVWLPRPLIATQGCRHRAVSSIGLEPGARLLVREELLLGRFGEDPGSVRQRLRVSIADRPLYDQEIAIGPEAEGWQAAAVTAGRRAIGCVLVVDPDWVECPPNLPPPRSETEAVLLRLAGPGAVVSALAGDALRLRRSLDDGMAKLAHLATMPAAAQADGDVSRSVPRGRKRASN
jgi:urease accessory protein